MNITASPIRILLILAAVILFIVAGIGAIGSADVSYRALIAFGLACLALAGLVP
jgi:hypothetical protein